jgi:hypothetical protein
LHQRAFVVRRADARSGKTQEVRVELAVAVLVVKEGDRVGSGAETAKLTNGFRPRDAHRAFGLVGGLGGEPIAVREDPAHERTFPAPKRGGVDGERDVGVGTNLAGRE